MAVAKLTSKGQVTIPKEVRDSLKLHTGDKIEFTVTKNQAIITPVSKKIDEVFGKLFHPDRAAIPVEVFDKTIRKRMKEKFNEGN
ncbi:AbrB/MazE/SpoVT family DNA-binding domain-containing protein [candidate division KSB1 bacterium]|nr:AbrB/MazE/SpoVT family DNA-binding domain-containing protein [candidate division KSB1 bacterium]